jgi:superfamily II DNA/RNA helicase
VAVTPQATTVERIAQRIVHVDRGNKPRMLTDLLRAETVDRVLVFTRTKHGADKVVRGLNKDGISAEAIHGNKSQGQRERALKSFRDGRVRTLVATDIAARGIDVDGISHVINFDLPNIPESYVHRIGRTARAGADGVAISLCSHDELPFLRDIERLIRMAIPATGKATPERPRQQQPHQQQRAHNGRGRNDHGRNDHGRNDHGRNDHGRNEHGRNEHGRNEHGRNEHGRKRQGNGGGGHRPQRSDRPQQQAQPSSSGPRPIASTQPISGDFAGVSFMHSR